MKEFSMFSLSGFGGLIILALDLWAIISVVNSDSTTGSKVMWVLLIIILPVIGFLIWLMAGPRGTRNAY